VHILYIYIYIIPESTSPLRPDNKNDNDSCQYNNNSGDSSTNNSWLCWRNLFCCFTFWWCSYKGYQFLPNTMFFLGLFLFFWCWDFLFAYASTSTSTSIRYWPPSTSWRLCEILYKNSLQFVFCDIFYKTTNLVSHKNSSLCFEILNSLKEKMF